MLLDVAELVRDRIVGLPDPLGEFHGRAALALVVHDLSADPSGLLGADAHLLAPLPGAVEVVGGDTNFQRVPGVVGVHIEPQHVGPVFFDRLDPLRHPVVHKFDAGRFAPVGDAVERGPLWVVLVAAGQRRDEDEVEARMIGDAGLEPDFFNRLNQFAVEVVVRPVIFRVVGIDRTVPVGKPVVMLTGGEHVFGAGLLEERGPRIGIPLRGGEQREKILVAEFRRRSEVFRVPLNDRGVAAAVAREHVAAIHVADIPLAAVRRHGVDAPVHHDAEFAVAKPRGVAVVFFDRFP